MYRKSLRPGTRNGVSAFLRFPICDGIAGVSCSAYFFIVSSLEVSEDVYHRFQDDGDAPDAAMKALHLGLLWFIRGETNDADKKARGNTFLILKDQTFSDFDLRLSFRCNATNNSGIQYRSQRVEDSASVNCADGASRSCARPRSSSTPRGAR